MSRTSRRAGPALVLCLLASVLAACGTVPRGENALSPSAGYAPHDPLEKFNRAVFTFNQKFDKYVWKPTARGYRAVLPGAVRHRVSDFFGNLHDPAIAVNELLQGKPKKAASDAARFLVNTTAGVLGLFDVGSHIGLPKHEEDFGLTLGVWGVHEGPYLVLPFLGPSDLRDAAGLVVDWQTYPETYITSSGTRDKVIVFEAIDKRAQLLNASAVLDQAGGEDPYVFMREFYRQHRRNQVYGGNPPPPPPPSELFEDEEPAPPPAVPKDGGAPGGGAPAS